MVTRFQEPGPLESAQMLHRSTVTLNFCGKTTTHLFCKWLIFYVIVQLAQSAWEAASRTQKIRA
jgi:hypothetical protein